MHLRSHILGEPRQALQRSRCPAAPRRSVRARARLSGSSKRLAEDLAAELAVPSGAELERWQSNIEVLASVSGRHPEERVRRTVIAHPELLSADLTIWHAFFVSGFGLPPDMFAKLVADCPHLLTQGDVFTAGCAMIFFKSMGWRNKDISQRIIGYYPQLLLLDRRRDIDPVVRFLERMNCTGENLRLLVWEYPRIFDKNYRRQVRKFQHLGVYGLTMQSSGSRASEASAAEEGISLTLGSGTGALWE